MGNTALQSPVIEQAPAAADEVVQESKPETHKVKDALSATGRGLHVAGAVISDVNLRSVGKGLKFLGRKMPKVSIQSRTTNEGDAS